MHRDTEHRSDDVGGEESVCGEHPVRTAMVLEHFAHEIVCGAEVDHRHDPFELPGLGAVHGGAHLVQTPHPASVRPSITFAGVRWVLLPGHHGTACASASNSAALHHGRVRR
ncbi:hypothetical protein, partial [Rhodococcus maanshanensis]|uniref:hypothetical protein n=1 Tax=Rhodococcus maanshanensis TaxID=183556 RepID=UPI001FE7D20D